MRCMPRLQEKTKKSLTSSLRKYLIILLKIYLKLKYSFENYYRILMIDIDTEKLIFDATLVHFSDEILQKEIEVNNAEFEFIHRF